MAKDPRELTRLTTIIPFKRPYAYPICGCGKPAEYEVYEHREPHCKECMLEAVDCEDFIIVRTIGTHYNDAS